MLASKKLQIGATFKTAKIPKQSPWGGNWGRVTKESLTLWIQCTGAKWDNIPDKHRKKPNKAEGEQLLEQCSWSH